MAPPDRYEPLPGVLGIPRFLLGKLSRRGRIAVAAVVLLALAGTAAALPGIVESKREHAAAEQREAERAHAARLVELRAELRRVDGRGTPARGLRGDAAVTARRALAADLAAAVTRDAAARADSGEFAQRTIRADCSRFPAGAHGEDPATDLAQRRGRYACLAITADIPAQAATSGGSIGYPYRALVDFPSGRFSFCKISGRPGELSVPRKIEVPVPAACGGG
jgi:hypothetical protein